MAGTGWAIPEAVEEHEREALLDKPLTLPWGEVLADRPLPPVRSLPDAPAAKDPEPTPAADEGPAPDREALARALAAQVAAALFDDAGAAVPSAEPSAPGQAETPKCEGAERFRPGPGLQCLLDEAARLMPESEPEAWVTTADGREQLQCRFPVSLPPNITVSAFEGFRRQWNAEIQSSDASGVIFHVGPSAGFWQRWLGRSAGLLIELRWGRSPANPIPSVTVRIRRAGKSTDDTLRELGPLLLDSLRILLQGPSNRRSERRLIWPHPVQVTFLLSTGVVSGTLEAAGKDLNRLGVGLYLPRILPGATVRLELTSPEQPDPVRVSGRFVRVHRYGQEWYEAAVLFRENDEEPVTEG